MESLLINIIIGFWLVAFGAMAIFPFIIESGAAARPSRSRVQPDAQQAMEDQILSIQPVAMADRTRGPIGEAAVAPEPAQRQAA